MLASIDAYSLSGSMAKALKSLSQTPLLAQREKRAGVFFQAPKPFGQIAPRRAGAEFPGHRIDEQPVAACAVGPDRTGPARPGNKFSIRAN